MKNGRVGGIKHATTVRNQQCERYVTNERSGDEDGSRVREMRYKLKEKNADQIDPPIQPATLI